MPNKPPASPLTFERPLVTVDVAIFSIVRDSLAVLLVQRPKAQGEPFPGRWALPGGFVDVGRDRSLQECAARKLRDKTGVASPYLEQLGTWGGSARDPRGWCVTTAYFALVPLPPEGAPMAPEVRGDPVPAQWLGVEEALALRLAFDHREILRAARERLRSKVEYTSLPAFLLPEPMTLPQLQHVYEVVLGRPLDKSAFRRRMLDAGFLQESEPVTTQGGRTAQGYRLLDRSAPTVFPRTFRSGEA